MTTFGAILAGTNARAKGRNAVVIARALARITGDRLVLVAVRSDPLVGVAPRAVLAVGRA